MIRERSQRSKMVPKMSDNLPQGHSITRQTFELFCSEQVMRKVKLMTKPGSNVAFNYADKPPPGWTKLNGSKSAGHRNNAD